MKLRPFHRHELLIVLSLSIIAVSVLLHLSTDTVIAPVSATTPSPVTRPSAAPGATSATPLLFDGASAMRFAQAQCDIGPRPPGTPEDAKTADYISKSIPAGWKIEEQKFTYRSVPIRNVVASRGQGKMVMVGAHYDTRPQADNDLVQPLGHILGANDGASGVAVLLELARVLPANPNKEIRLAFFDAEDSGGINGWPWSVGAEHVAATLTVTPQAVVVLDMIGDIDQQIYYEANSDSAIQQAIFAQAAALGYGANFIPQVRYTMTDDHTPFLERGFRAVDLIDFDYPFWHTMKDTCDKIGPQSLERVGRTMQSWLTQ
jgi:Zn-dependent M28 family amino/carboxypeptidase